jgi:hypothetical protein
MIAHGMPSIRTTLTAFCLAPLLLWLLLPASPASAVAHKGPPSDQFITGYASAVLEREFPGKSITLTTEQSVVVVHCPGLGRSERERLVETLSRIPGVGEVRLAEDVPDDRLPPPPTPRNLQEPDILPRGTLFPALLADPRWPHFSASYQYYSGGNSDLRHVGSATFGETFSLIRYRLPQNREIDLGIQAGVFSVFDLDTTSTDLINSDFRVAIPLSYRHEEFSALFRVFHQSSHLGDEFILRGLEEERVNLSYESLHLLLSQEFDTGYRIYAGGGFIFRKEPSDLKPWSFQGGLEYRSPVTWWNGTIRPLAALDLQIAQESEWDIDVSIRTGVQFENPDLLGRKLQLLLEYYTGHSPNGQFFDRTIHYLGLGVHVHLY